MVKIYLVSILSWELIEAVTFGVGVVNEDI